MIPNIAIGDLTIDCANASRTRDFYAELTGWVKTIAFDCLALKTHGGLMLLFCEPDDAPYVPPGLAGGARQAAKANAFQLSGGEFIRGCRRGSSTWCNQGSYAVWRKSLCDDARPRRAPVLPVQKISKIQKKVCKEGCSFPI
ncbi:MAG TPA: hypothetical protein PKB13_12910, partial [Clostridia bacterium]|nr:hypothetical protein [Clostridia bacterium]